MTDHRPPKLTRGEQLRLIEDWQPIAIKAGDGVTVKPATLAAVLSAIDRRAGDGGECFASQSNLAHMTKLSTKTIGRAVSVLVRLGIITLHRRTRHADSKPLNHHRVCHDRLRQPIAVLLCETEQTDVASLRQTDAPSRANGRAVPTKQTRRPEQTDAPSRANRRSVPLTNKEPTKNRPTTTPKAKPLCGEWRELFVELFDDGRGMTNAEHALTVAHDAGLTVATIRGWWLLATIKPRDATKPPGLGALFHWMTDKTVPPESPERAQERYRQWLTERERQAEAIRKRIQREASEQKPTPRAEVIAGLIARALDRAGLAANVTAAERSAADWLGECDRRKAGSSSPDDRPMNDLLSDAAPPRLQSDIGIPRAEIKRPPREQSPQQRRAALAQVIADDAD